MLPETPEYIILLLFRAYAKMEEHWLKWQRAEHEQGIFNYCWYQNYLPKLRGIKPDLVEQEIRHPGTTSLKVVLSDNGSVITVLDLCQSTASSDTKNEMENSLKKAMARIPGIEIKYPLHSGIGSAETLNSGRLRGNVVEMHSKFRQWEAEMESKREKKEKVDIVAWKTQKKLRLLQKTSIQNSNCLQEKLIAAPPPTSSASDSVALNTQVDAANTNELEVVQEDNYVPCCWEDRC
jgi:hypothetical protein